MHHAIALLSELSQNHLDWIFDNGVQQQVDTHDVVILEGSHPDAIYFVLKGVVGIYSKSAGDRQIAGGCSSNMLHRAAADQIDDRIERNHPQQVAE